MLDYRISEKAPFTIVGIKKRCNTDTSYQEIPKFWTEHLARGEERSVIGTFGVCVDMGGKDFDYWIADLYQPWDDIPEDCETHQIPGGLWAQFTCKGALPDSLQNTHNEIWDEWLPSLQGYELAGKYNMEVYGPPTENPEDSINYIWMPLKKSDAEAGHTNWSA